MSTTGTIREWHHDEGWGVIESPALSGTVHVSTFVVRVRAVQNLDELSCRACVRGPSSTSTMR